MYLKKKILLDLPVQVGLVLTFGNSKLFNRGHTKEPYLAYIKQMGLVSVLVTILL